MSVAITENIRRELDREPGVPVRLVDAERDRHYVLVSAEAWDRICALFGGRDPFDIRDTYAVQDEAAAAAWSHPQDAEYDNSKV